MGQIQVMLVEDDVSTLNSIAAYLRGKPFLEIIATATNGKEAVDLLSSIDPDVIVLDIVMPLLDGFGLLEEMRLMKRHNFPKVIMLTGFRGDRFISRTMELGAYYYMCKPCDVRLLYKRIVESQTYLQPTLVVDSIEAQDTPSDQVEALLERQGLYSGTKGYNYLHSAIQLGLEIDPISGKITKELYPAIAHLYGTTTDRVERSIRHMIEKGWTSGGIQASNTFPSQKRPSNGEYIAKMVRLLSVKKQPSAENKVSLLN